MRSKALPMVPDCALDPSGARLQLERYREVGEGASLIERTPRRLTVELDRRVDGQLVGELLATERECCTFFDIAWERERRRLTFSVPRVEHEPALAAILFALDLDAPAGS